MPRPERPLDKDAGPVQLFASELRLLREKAGNPKYLQMARATGRSRTALSEAAGGDHLPTWQTVEAYVTACGGNLPEWLDRWESAQIEVERARSSDRLPEPPVPPEAYEPLRQTSIDSGRKVGTRRLSTWLASGCALLIVGAGATAGISLLEDRAQSAGGVRPIAAWIIPRGRRLVVQNKVAVGFSGLYEDTTPSYLSTKTEPECANYGCEVPHTQMWSGAVLWAICEKVGAVITNADLSSTGIDRNKGKLVSDMWYFVKMRNGAMGYISAAYLKPTSLSGLQAPACR
jgi:hypothetical protein